MTKHKVWSSEYSVLLFGLKEEIQLCMTVFLHNIPEKIPTKLVGKVDFRETENGGLGEGDTYLHWILSLR